MAVRISSKTKLCEADPAGSVAGDFAPGKLSGGGEGGRDGGIEVCARDIAERVDHGHDHESEGEGNARVADHSAVGVIADDGPGAGEDEGEGAEEFCQIAGHGSAVHQQDWPDGGAERVRAARASGPVGSVTIHGSHAVRGASWRATSSR